jgi:hypothetical protein
MNAPEPAFITSSILAAVAAILTIAQAVPNIDKRLARVRDIEREIGRMPVLIRYVYVWPQYFYKIVLIIITFVGVLMVGTFIYSVVDQNARIPAWLQALKGGGIWLVATWLTVGAAMYVNAVSWILIVLLGIMHPLRLVIGAHPWNQDPSWPALLTFIWLNENAKPLIVSTSHAALFANWLVRMAAQQPVPNRAAPPATSARDLEGFRERIGNALLAGCIIEDAHHRSPDFPRQVWGRFYQAIGDMAMETGQFTRASVLVNYNDAAFYTDLLADLNKRLLHQAMQLAVSEAQQAVQRAQQALHAAQQAHGAVGPNAPQLVGNSQQKIQEQQQALAAANQVLATAQQRLQTWEAVQPTVAAVQLAEQKVAIAEEAARATPSAIVRQAVEQARQTLQAAQQTARNAEQVAEQTVAQDPPANYAPIPNSLALRDGL